MGDSAHNLGEGRFLVMSNGRICAFLAIMIAVSVGPTVLRGERGQRLGASMAPTGAAAAAVVASMVWSVGEL